MGLRGRDGRGLTRREGEGWGRGEERTNHADCEENRGRDRGLTHRSWHSDASAPKVGLIPLKMSKLIAMCYCVLW